ncbi:hypothetical protein [Paenibacillus alkalitolerans]|uniref:hypothetical protein n=1 Tax=Paenibacillus alkalitolerans TaxID=2799335 RepID=UPI0018F782FC|nr:hypothetical protein [Paenibacillus alkalitolerans]
MAPQIDTNALKKAEACTSIAKDLITQAIEQSAANATLCQEALLQASGEIKEAFTLVNQVQSALQPQQS